MAERVTSEVEYIEQDNPKVKTRIVERIVRSAKLKTPLFLDGLITLTIVSQYFFWTGLCILFGRPIPREWMRLATTLTQGKIAKKVNDLATQEVEKKPVTHQVIDLETKRPMVFSGEPGSGLKPLTPSN